MASKALVKVPDVNAAQRALAPMVRAARMSIQNDAEYLQAGIWMKRADEFLAGPLVQFFIKHAIDAASVHKQAVFARDAVRKQALGVKRILGEKRIGYRTRKESAAAKKRAIQEEKLRLQQIAETKDIAKQMRLQGDKRGAASLVKAAENAPAPTLPARSVVPEEEGFVTKKTYAFLIEDPRVVPNKYYAIDESLIRKDVDTFGLDADIPGVRIWEVKKEHTRKAKP